MTNRIWPVDAVAGAPAYSGRALRQTQAPFVAGATAARPLGGYSGVRPGTPASTLVVSPTAWTIRPHGGVLDVQTAAEAGPYTYAIDTAVSGTVTAADSSNPRTDIVYVRVTDAAEDGAAPGIAGNVTIGYLAGNPAPVPTAPAAPARSIVLGRVNVPKAGGGNPTASWVAPVAVAAGAPFLATTKAELDLIPGVSGARAIVFGDAALLNGNYEWARSAWRLQVQSASYSAVGAYNNSPGVQQMTPAFRQTAEEQANDFASVYAGVNQNADWNGLLLQPGTYVGSLQTGMGATISPNSRNISLVYLRRGGASSREEIGRGGVNYGDDSCNASFQFTITEASVLSFAHIVQVVVNPTTVRHTVRLTKVA